MATAMIIVSIVSIALGVVSSVTQELTSTYGSWIRKDMNTLANQLKAIMSQDQSFKEQLQQAYSEKNTNLMQSMMLSKGFGPRFTSLKNELERVKKNYESKIKEVNEHYTKASSAVDDLTSHSAYAGSSIGSNVHAIQEKDKGNQILSSLRTSTPVGTAAEAALVRGGAINGGSK